MKALPEQNLISEFCDQNRILVTADYEYVKVLRFARLDIKL